MSKRNEKKCSMCDGMEAICEICCRADGDCICSDGPELVPCPKCKTGTLRGGT